VDLVEATENFARATQHCVNLITVHRGHGGPARGRRAPEVSLNRAVVVLTVASWQSVIQDFTRAAVELSTPASGGPVSRATYSALTGHVSQQISAFATPNWENVRKLMQGAGFDPRPHWTWTQLGGQGVGTVTWTPTMASNRINEWLQVRHAIAHGHDELPQVPALQAVRLNQANPPADPRVRLVDAEQCLAFFRRLARITGASLAAHLGVPAP
jgi:hypothetical protein